MLVGGQKPVPEAMGNSPDEKMDTESTNGVELCRVSLIKEHFKLSIPVVITLPQFIKGLVQRVGVVVRIF